MAEKPDAKADFDGLKWLLVFQRVGKSFTGLLLLEIGWVLLLTLAARLSKEGETPALGLPGFLRLQRPLLEMVTVPLTSVWLYGALLIVVGWMVYSRFAQYLTAPCVILARLLLTLAFAAVWGVVLLVSFGLLLVDLAVQWLYRKSHAAPPASAGVPGATGQGKPLKWINPALLLNFMDRLQARFLLPIGTEVRVGVAAAISRSRSDELTVAMPAFPNLEALTVSVREVMDDLALVDGFRLYPIPSHFSINSERRARFVRWLFGLDVVIWGGFIDEAGQTIWIKYQGPSVHRPLLRLEPVTEALQVEGRMFPGSVGAFTPQVQALTFSTRDDVQALTVVLLGILVAFRHKQDKEKAPGLSHIMLDRLAPDTTQQLAREDFLAGGIERLMLHLLFDRFRTLPETPARAAIFPSLETQMARFVGDWVGHQLLPDLRSSERLLARMPRARFLSQLYGLMEKCRRLMPDTAEHCYRSAAIACLLDDSVRALRLFKQGQAMDAQAYRIEDSVAQATAEVVVTGARYLPAFEGELAMACYVAHVARALGFKGMTVVKSVRNTLAKSVDIELLGLGVDAASAPAAMRVLLQMLDEASLADGGQAPSA